MLRQANVRGDQSPAAAATEGHPSQEGAQASGVNLPHSTTCEGRAMRTRLGLDGAGEVNQCRWTASGRYRGPGVRQRSWRTGGRTDGRRRMSWGSPVVQAGDGVELRQQMRRGCGLRPRGR